MAVAVKNPPEASSARLLPALAAGSLAGAAFVLAGLAVIFYGLPTAWWTAWRGMGLAGNSAVGYALLFALMVAVAIGWFVAGTRLARGSVHGVRAGVFVALVGILVALWLASVVGRALGRTMGPGSPAAAGVTLGVGLVLLVGLVYLFMRGSLDKTLLVLEDQGWFTAASYKRTQGQRVRRGTILGILILAGAGVYTLLAHGTLEGAGDWGIHLPLGDGVFVPILPHVRFTLPLLLTAASLWLAYRIVNLPVFADFLIATEAEMNKVSWTTRARLVQDTIVVLVTVILLTVFLFVVDQVWAHLLTRVGVLKTPTETAAPTQREQPW